MKNKKGKKLVVLGAMAALLTLIGVSGSQTYAKYVESKDIGSQTATVAKWGYVVTVENNELFGDAYGDVASSLAKVDTYADDPTLVVKAKSENSPLVAPGTKGNMTINVQGYAEVDVNFTFKSSLVSDINLGAVYYPMKWAVEVDDVLGTLGSQGTTLETTYGDKSDKKLSTLFEVMDGTTFHFDANTTVNFTITLSWEWAYEDLTTYNIPNKTTSSNDTLSGDVSDTILGILANGSGSDKSFQYDYDKLDTDYDYETSVEFDLKITATQVQNG